VLAGPCERSNYHSDSINCVNCFCFQDCHGIQLEEVTMTGIAVFATG
jgi:hypothetical protein